MQNVRVVPADDDDDDQATEMNNSFTGEGVVAPLQPLCLLSFSFCSFLCLCMCSSLHLSSPVDACQGVSAYTCVYPRLAYMFLILYSVARRSVSGGYIMSLWCWLLFCEPPNTATCLWGGGAVRQEVEYRLHSHNSSFSSMLQALHPLPPVSSFFSPLF